MNPDELDRTVALEIVRVARDFVGLSAADRAFFELWLAAHPDPSG